MENALSSRQAKAKAKAKAQAKYRANLSQEMKHEMKKKNAAYQSQHRSQLNEREKQEMKQKNIAYQSQHRSQLNEHTKEAIKTKDAAYQSQHRSQLNEHTKEAIKTKDAAAHAKRRRALVTSQMNVKRRKRSHADVDFDSAAYDILQLVHDLSGHTISSNAAFNKSDEGLIRDDIQLHAFISDMQKSKLIKDFQAAMPLDKPLFACASCGIRDVMQQYTSWEIAKLPAAFKLTSVQVEKMSNTSKNFSAVCLLYRKI